MSTLLDGYCKYCNSIGWVLLLTAATGKDACKCPMTDGGEHEFIWPKQDPLTGEFK